MTSISTNTLFTMPSFLFISLLMYGAEVPTISASCASFDPCDIKAVKPPFCRLTYSLQAILVER